MALLWKVLLVSTIVLGAVSLTSGVIIFYVTEELPSGTRVGSVKESSNVTAEVTSAEADRLQFQILSSDGLRVTSSFSINSRTGVIFTNAMIDREQICDTQVICKLEFDVSVSTDVRFVKLLTVRIFIDDINDNAPVFPKREINLTVTESSPLGSEIPISGALDKDAGLSTNISYALHVSDMFVLKEVKRLDGSSALKLQVALPLDRESVASYSFLILASDGQGPGTHTGTLTVNVVITDVNDNPPRFSQDAFNLTVMETAPAGTVFGYLAAQDEDVGENAQLRFRFSPLTSADVTGLFRLNETSGELSVAADLGYQANKRLQCFVEVTDGGLPPQVSQAILRVLVQDAGNTPPRLDLILAEPSYAEMSTMLFEDVQLGYFLGKLVVEDLDEGAEGQVTCQSADSRFALQALDASSTRYGIVVSKPLDREERQEVRVALVCSDGGVPRLSSTASFTVLLRDVNDNPPVFVERMFMGSVAENGAAGDSVIRVMATDRDDSTNNVITSYSLDAASSLLFSIHPLTGWITTKKSFDRELTQNFQLIVYAVDSGTPPLTGTGTVSVRIADVNDNIPRVNRTDYYISESAPVGHVINISVADEDEGLNATVVLIALAGESSELSSGSPSLGSSSFSSGSDPSYLSPLEVLANGSLRVRGRLDRETADRFYLPVLARDRGVPMLTSTSTLTIVVIDSNDHSPAFVFPSLTNSSVRLAVDLPVGSPVCQVRAVDPDQGPNGHVTYSISGGNEGQWLGINNQTGDLFIIRPLLALAGSSIQLRIRASDYGSPPQTSQAFLDVHVGATNGTFLPGVGGATGQNFVVIAGVIAGVTFVVAVVVVAIIVHLRNADVRRRRAGLRQDGKGLAKMVGGGGGGAEVDDLSWRDTPKSLSALSMPGRQDSKKSNTYVTGGRHGPLGSALAALESGGFEPREPSGTTKVAAAAVPAAPIPEEGGRGAAAGGGGGGNGGGGSGGEAGRQSEEKAPVEHLLPTFCPFPDNEARNRLVSEDHSSETSGETTTSDSGRGASDEEIVFPLSHCGTVFFDHPPRVPPREPLAATTGSLWPRDAGAHLTSGLWSPRTDVTAHYLTEEVLDTSMSSPASKGQGQGQGQGPRIGKGSLKVRFSFDDGGSASDGHSQNLSEGKGFAADFPAQVARLTGFSGHQAGSFGGGEGGLSSSPSQRGFLQPAAGHGYHPQNRPQHQQQPQHQQHQQQQQRQQQQQQQQQQHFYQQQQQHKQQHLQQQQQQQRQQQQHQHQQQQHQQHLSSTDLSLYGSQNVQRARRPEGLDEAAHSSSRETAATTRLNPDTLYPRAQPKENFPRKHLSMQGANAHHARQQQQQQQQQLQQQQQQQQWEAARPKARHSESMSSLPHSVDDDGSTTTSGSYSIDLEDAMNASLEC